MRTKHDPASLLSALTPLDGRYHHELSHLSPILSEMALIKTRLEVEIMYLRSLSKKGVTRKLTEKELVLLNNLLHDFEEADAQRIKDIETVTKHDVKAVELFLREALLDTSLNDLLEMIHFGITSEDINNIAYRLMLKRATEHVLYPSLLTLLEGLLTLSDENKTLPMLARTHGQAAIPTTLGKELAVFAARLHKELQLLKQATLCGKFSGAVGNFNALSLAYPDIDWEDFTTHFVGQFGLEANLMTTQINTYEDITAYLQVYHRINTLLIDLDQDMWRYISDGWFIQEVKKDEVGSSTMPQKVNPIFFEGSEGNLGLANALIEFMTRKLPVSRLQRDLSDSTVIRNISTIAGYNLLAYQYVLRALSRVKPNPERIGEDLMQDWSILAEAAQTMLRQEGVEDAYMLVKDLTQGTHIKEEHWKTWVAKLPLTEKNKSLLSQLTPATYIGRAIALTEKTLKSISSSQST